MRRSLTEWIVSKLSPHRPPVVDDLPNTEDEAAVGISRSIESLHEAHSRRPKVDEIVHTLDEYRKTNNFGQKIDEVFLQVHKEQRP